jgi:AraC-like DNA-binding protein
MQKGDDAFNARDFATVDTVHDRNMVAHLTGNAQPIYGSVAHAAAMQQMLQVFPDMHVNAPYPIQFGKGDWITVVTRATRSIGEIALAVGFQSSSSFSTAFTRAVGCSPKSFRDVDERRQYDQRFALRSP